MLRAPMARRPLVSIALAAVTATIPSASRADDAIPKDLPRLLLDTGRLEEPPPDKDQLRFTMHGEYQLRYQAQRTFPLTATTSAMDRRPGLVEESTGQRHFTHHWLRVRPRLLLRDTLQLVGQLDVVTGLLPFGERARDTSEDLTPRDTFNGFDNIQLRWLYAQVNTPIGVLRIGQQPNHWGMGILTNDGDHPPLFGDYRYGSISERVLFATRPGGKDTDFVIAVAGDLVYRDNTARLSRGDHAFQGVLAAFYEHGFDRLGVFSTLRHQTTDRTSGPAVYTYVDSLDALAVDAHGRVAVPVPNEKAFFFAEAEGVVVLGSTNIVRTQDQALDGSRTSVLAYGGAAMLGVVHKAEAKDVGQGRASAYGDLVAQLEAGYASGDSDPYDGTQRRLVFDPNHKVGLLLFDEVLRFQTARSATAAADPLLANSQRRSPGLDQLPSNGGVFGAQYLNPTVIYRPRPWLDLKGGAVIAQATADIVDPYLLTTTGSYVNYRGGNPRKKDLGVELDAGVEARFPLRAGLNLALGAQGGVLFPGGAMENALGERLKTQWVTIARGGLLF